MKQGMNIEGFQKGKRIERVERRGEGRKGLNERERETRVCSIRGEVGFFFPSGRKAILSPLLHPHPNEMC